MSLEYGSSFSQRRHTDMTSSQHPVSSELPDRVWDQLIKEAANAAEQEPVLADLIEKSILAYDCLEMCLAHRISHKLGHHAVSEPYLQELFQDIFQADPNIGRRIRLDIIAIDRRDPASCGFLSPVLYFKGFQALTAYRVAHFLWTHRRQVLARYLQSIISQVFAVDIHPGARIGEGILFDHATSIVIGETAVIGNNVSILHEVTLGGTGKIRGDRHPKVQDCVLIGAGAKILGNVTIGRGSQIGAGSVVLQDIPPHMTAAGVPAKVVGAAHRDPANAMDHHI
jgi:serine O-acetyltransferase